MHAESADHGSRGGDADRVDSGGRSDSGGGAGGDGRISFIGPDSAPDRYRLVRRIGRGGEAVLYLAELELSGQSETVVVKMLDERRTLSVEHYEKISSAWREQAELLRFVNRPGVVGIREHFEGPVPHPQGEADATRGQALCLVMNFVDGRDLWHWRSGRSPHTPAAREEGLRCLEQLAEVLDWLHSGSATPSRRTVVHGDLSPGNVMVDGDGQAVLVDFGLSKLSADHLTTELRWTPGFAAPEVFLGRRTPAADRYAFGAIAYFVLSGAAPAETRDAPGQALAALPELAPLDPARLAELAAIFADDPADRPASLTAWVGALRSALLPAPDRAAQPLIPAPLPPTGPPGASPYPSAPYPSGPASSAPPGSTGPRYDRPQPPLPGPYAPSAPLPPPGTGGPARTGTGGPGSGYPPSSLPSYGRTAPPPAPYNGPHPSASRPVPAYPRAPYGTGGPPGAGSRQRRVLAAGAGLVVAAVAAVLLGQHLAGGSGTVAERETTGAPVSASTGGPRPTTPAVTSHATSPAGPKDMAVPYVVLAPGKCFDTPTLSDVQEIVVLACDTPHDAEVVANETLSGDFASDEEIQTRALDLCTPDAEDHLPQDDQVYYPYALFPNLVTYEIQGRTTVTCSLTRNDGNSGTTMDAPLG